MGFSPDVFENEDVLGEDFVHPEDWETMIKAITYCESKLKGHS